MYLHRQGVVHANLKPTNVLLAADGIPRIVDFRWIAGKFWPPVPEGDPDSPAPPGLGYLAPELVRDHSAEPRPYTDIYGLGLILYESLTGRPPFGGSHARQMLEQIVSHDPVPPSRLNPEVSPQLEAICLQCLRRNPWRRFRRAYDLMRGLQHIQDERFRRAPADGFSISRGKPGR
jgi:serine/threonine protein kinase